MKIGEILKEIGIELTEEQTAKIKDSKDYVLQGSEGIPKERLDKEIAAKKEAIQKQEEMQKKLDELSKSSISAEEMQKKIEEIKTQATKDIETANSKLKDYETEVSNMKKQTLNIKKEAAIKEILRNKGAADVDLAYLALTNGRMNLDNVSFNESGKIEGVADIIDNFATEKTILFAQVDTKTDLKGSTPNPPKGGGQVDESKLSDEEYFKLHPVKKL